MTTMDGTKQRITTCLWFDSNAEEAVQFYTSIFKDSRITGLARYGESGSEASGKPKGTVMTISFELQGREFLALNGGPTFTFTPAVSFIVKCETQEELDTYWEKLSGGGEIQQCGWLTDKYGVSWQIVPSILGEMMQGKDAEKTNRAMKALIQMRKIDMGALKKAYEGLRS